LPGRSVRCLSVSASDWHSWNGPSQSKRNSLRSCGRQPPSGRRTSRPPDTWTAPNKVAVQLHDPHWSSFISACAGLVVLKRPTAMSPATLLHGPAAAMGQNRQSQQHRVLSQPQLNGRRSEGQTDDRCLWKGHAGTDPASLRVLARRRRG
jgi:hypothetical protein